MVVAHMAWFLITLRPTRLEMLTSGPTAKENTAVGAHFQYLVRLHAEGVLKLAGRTQDAGPETMGLALVQASSVSEAEAIMVADPAIVAGVFRGTLQPYAIAVGG